MTSHGTPSDAGFVVLDALLATILLATAGTVILVIATTAIRQRDAELDRSVGLLMSQSLMRQYLLVGPAGVPSLETSDELYAYSIEPARTADVSGVQLVDVVVTSKGAAAPTDRLSFLALTSGATGR